MRVTVLAVGDELTSGLRRDENAGLLCRLCFERGHPVQSVAFAPDRLDVLERLLREQACSAELLLVTGGLGPTADDMTRFAAAALVDKPLEFHAPSWAKVERMFASRGVVCPDGNRIQAMFPAGAEVLDNALGTADGFAVRHHGCRICFLPGVPYEMRAMLEQVLPEPAGDGRSVLSCLYAGLPESGLDTAIRTEVLPVLAPQDRYLICAGQGFLKVRLVIQHPETAARVRRRLRSIFPDCCLSRTGLDPWPILVRLLARMRQSLAAAESCTGGAFGARLTAVPGASAVFRGAVVAYADAVKRDVLHVPGETLERHGAVSEETARAMAVGARRVLGSDLAISLTGIAGPDGGTPAKPVGTVCIGLAGGDASFSETRLFRGDREAVREQAAAAALRLILKHLSINHG